MAALYASMAASERRAEAEGIKRALGYLTVSLTVPRLNICWSGRSSGSSRCSRIPYHLCSSYPSIWTLIASSCRIWYDGIIPWYSQGICTCWGSGVLLAAGCPPWVMCNTGPWLFREHTERLRQREPTRMVWLGSFQWRSRSITRLLWLLWMGRITLRLPISLWWVWLTVKVLR